MIAKAFANSNGAFFHFSVDPQCGESLRRNFQQSQAKLFISGYYDQFSERVHLALPVYGAIGDLQPWPITMSFVGA